MHNYHITHKVFLACTIIGSTPSVLGCLLCLSQQWHAAPLPPGSLVTSSLSASMTAMPARTTDDVTLVEGGS